LLASLTQAGKRSKKIIELYLIDVRQISIIYLLAGIGVQIYYSGNPGSGRKLLLVSQIVFSLIKR